MKFQITNQAPGSCQITLIPESDADKKLAVATDGKNEQQIADTFQHYYQRAITFKFGPKAHLDGITAVNYPLVVNAIYILEGPGLG